MSDGDVVGYPVLKIKVDDSDVMPSLRNSLQAAQAYVDANVIRVGGGVGTPGGTASTFSSVANGTATQPNAYASTGGFAVNTPSKRSEEQDDEARLRREEIFRRYAGSNVSDSAIARAESLYQAGAKSGAFEETEGRPARRSAAAASGTSQQSPEESAAGLLSAQRNKAIYDRQFDRLGNPYRLSEEDIEPTDRTFGERLQDQFRRVSPLRLVGYSLAAIHEASRTTRAMNEGEFEANVATSPVEELQARMRQQERAWSGLAGSIGGAALDVFGAGPESFLTGARQTLGAMQSQDALREAMIQARYQDRMRSAELNRSPFESRRATASLAGDQANEDAQRIRYLTSRLGATREETYQTGDRSMFANADDAGGSDTGGFATRTVYQLQGDERNTALSNRERFRLAQAQHLADQATQNSLADKEYADADIRLRGQANVARLSVNGDNPYASYLGTLNESYNDYLTAPRELQGQVADLNRFRNQRAFNDLMQSGRSIGRGLRGQMATGRVLQDQLNDNPLQAELDTNAESRQQELDANADRFRGMGFIGRGLTTAANFLTNQNYDRRDRLATRNRTREHDQIGRQLTFEGDSTREQLDAYATGSRRSPAATEARRDAFTGMEQATQLGQRGFRDLQRQELKNTGSLLDLDRANYLNGFRGTQIDLNNMSVTNRADQTDPAAVLKEIRQFKTDVIKAINALGNDN